jgi:hypothetical protein
LGKHDGWSESRSIQLFYRHQISTVHCK